MSIDLQMQHVPGPLEQFKLGFAGHLSNLGYVPESVRILSRLVRDFDHGSLQKGLASRIFANRTLLAFRQAGRRRVGASGSPRQH